MHTWLSDCFPVPCLQQVELPAYLVLDMFRVLFLKMTICFKLLCFGGQSPPSLNWESQEKTRMSALEQTWVCGQVGLATCHPQWDECVHRAQGGSVTSFWEHITQTGRKCAPPAGRLPAQEGSAEGAELCPLGSFSHNYWSDQSPALTWGEGAAWKHGVGMSVPPT